MVERVPPQGVIAVLAQPGGGIWLDAGGRQIVVVETQQQPAHVARPAQHKQRRQMFDGDLHSLRVLLDEWHSPRVWPEERIVEGSDEVPPGACVVLREGRVRQEEEHVTRWDTVYLRQLPIDYPQVLHVQRDQVWVADVAMLYDRRQRSLFERRNQLLRVDQKLFFFDV